MAFKG
jgi:hypothetical protein